MDDRGAGDFSLVGEFACGLCGGALPDRRACPRATASQEARPALAVVADRNVSRDFSQSVRYRVFPLPEARTVDGASLCSRMERGLESGKRVDGLFHFGRA